MLFTVKTSRSCLSVCLCVHHSNRHCQITVLTSLWLTDQDVGLPFTSFSSTYIFFCSAQQIWSMLNVFSPGMSRYMETIPQNGESLDKYWQLLNHVCALTRRKELCFVWKPHLTWKEHRLGSKYLHCKCRQMIIMNLETGIFPFKKSPMFCLEYSEATKHQTCDIQMFSVATCF